VRLVFRHPAGARIFSHRSGEKAPYQPHNNHPKDVCYQKFVSAIVKRVIESFSTDRKGLNFGCGKDS
jgi:hypothetical protein